MTQDRLAWLDARRKGIGASDMPAICGVSPYQTALGIYLSKVNPVNPSDEKLPFDDPRRVGQIAEPTIARLYAEKTGKSLIKGPAQTVHPSLSWMNASLDYLHADDHEPVDCKNVTTTDRDELAKWGEDGTDQVPHYIAIQMHQQIEVSGAPRAHVAAFFHGRTLKVYTINRDDQIVIDLIEIGNTFWEMVENRTPPEPDWSHRSTPKVIRKLYNRVEPRTVKLGQVELAMLKKFFENDDAIKKMAIENEEIDVRLRAAIGNAQLAEFPEGYRMTRKETNRKEVIIPSYSYIDFKKFKPSKSKKKPSSIRVSTIPAVGDVIDAITESIEQEGSTS